MVLPSGLSSAIRSIDTYQGSVQEAFPPMSVSITLEDDIDVSRGDMIVKENNQPQMEQDIDVMLCWLNDQGPQPGAKYTVRQATRETRAVIKDVVDRKSTRLNSSH